ncbi:MAG: aspartate kinase [Firmicutes bacterium]|nr:aspartate kinase [Bacillota bacterium]
MAVKVSKFGGSSVADGIQLNKIKEIIKSDPERRYIVVSAPGKRFDGDNKITDLLYLVKTTMENVLPYEQLFQVVCDRYTAVHANLGLTVDMQAAYDEILEKLKTNPSADYIASRGEYLNAMLIADLLGFDFVDAEGMIKFDENGRFLMEETNQAIRDELLSHEYAVIPGFYGSLPNGDIKTFPRGGSDITGSLVAGALGAECYENWTDVSGFLMADPRIVKNPKQIRTVSYKELRELSYMGASVLHEDAIYPARLADVPINIRNTNDPDDPGTMIVSQEKAIELKEKSGESDIITGIAGSKDFTVVALYKNIMSQERGFVRRILGILDDYNINFEHLPSGIDTVSVVMSNKQINGRLDEIINEFQSRLRPDSIDVIEGIAQIATVGHQMSARRGTAAKLFTALAEAGVNIRMIDQGSSELNIIVGVDNKDFNKAIQAIYGAFVEA